MDGDALPELAELFADNVHGKELSRDELVQEFVRFGQRLRNEQSGDPKARLKIAYQIDGNHFSADGPAYLVVQAVEDWKRTASDGLYGNRRINVMKNFNRPLMIAGRSK
jgi:hypothetical protein